MHHYEGELTLRSTFEGGRQTPIRTGLRPHVRLANETVGVQIDLIQRDEVRPGESAFVGVSFLFPELVYALIRAGEKYPVCEGAKEIGTLSVRADVWKDEGRRVHVGAEYAATVKTIGWTSADVELENGWTAALQSRDVGLAPWAEIGDALQLGQRLRVRVEAVDPIARIVELSLSQTRRPAG